MLRQYVQIIFIIVSILICLKGQRQEPVDVNQRRIGRIVNNRGSKWSLSLVTLCRVKCERSTPEVTIN